MPKLTRHDTMIVAALHAYLHLYATESQTSYEDAVGALFVAVIAQARHDLAESFDLAPQKAADLVDEIYRNQQLVFDARQPPDSHTN